MSVQTERVYREYFGVVANVPISVDVPAYRADYVKVYYGDSEEATQPADFSVTLSADFSSFFVTPTAALIAKLPENRRIVVRRELDYLSEMSEARAQFRRFISDEFDNTLMRIQQLADTLSRSLSLPPGETMGFSLPSLSELKGKILSFDAVTGSPEATPFTTAQVATAIDAVTLNTLVGDAAYYAGDGVTTHFLLPEAWRGLGSSLSLWVQVQAPLQWPTKYAINGDYVVFVAPPPAPAYGETQSVCMRLAQQGAQGVPGKTTGPDATVAGYMPAWADAEGRTLSGGVPPSGISVTATGGTAARTLANRFADYRNVLDYTNPSTLPDITAGLNAAAAAIRATAEKRGGIFIPSGRFVVTGGINLTGAAGQDVRINLVGAGVNATWLSVDMDDAFPALDFTGNSYATCAGMTIQHATDCASTCTVQAAKPTGGGGAGQRITLRDLDIQRQSNSTNDAPCVIVANADLPVVDNCNLFGRAGIWWGTIDTAVLTSEFQALSTTFDFTKGTINDTVINCTDYALQYQGSSGNATQINGGYFSVIGDDVPAIDGAKAIIHVLGASGGLSIAGLRTENQTSPAVTLDGVIALHGNTTYSTLDFLNGCPDTVVWVGASANVSGTSISAFCDFNIGAVFKSAGGSVTDTVVSVNRSSWSVGTLTSDLRNSWSGQYLTSPNGSQAAPGLRLGSANAGYYIASRADQYSGATAVGLSMDGIGIEFFRSGATQISVGPGAAASATSAGYALRLLGGAPGTTSGNSGAVSLVAQTPVDGNGGAIVLAASAGVGTNRQGGAINAVAGASTGTTAGGPVSIKAGANNTAGSYGGNTTIGAGDSSAGYPGSLYLDSGIGTANGGVAEVGLRNRALGPIKLQTGGANRWAIDGNGSYASHFRPEANGAYNIGVADLRVGEIFLTNSPNVSSDINGKLDIAQLDPAACAVFISSLRPTTFRLANAGKVVVGYADRKELVTEVDPLTHQETTREVGVRLPVEEDREGVRRHAGLIAQEVKTALEACFPGQDMALWGLADPTNPDSRQFLRYEQVIPFLIGAVAHLSARMDAHDEAQT